MTANDKLTQIISILGSTEADPARLAVAAYKLGMMLQSGTPTITKSEARRIAGAHVGDATDLDSILSALSKARLVRIETQEDGKAGRPQTLITAL
jgi:hypothetical protein